LRRLVNILTIAGWLLCLFCAPRVLAQTGTVLGFGLNTNGQLGDGTPLNRSLPTPAHQISGVKAISCGYHHTLALDSSGVVWAWGYNGQGQLGTHDTANHTRPVPVLENIKAISAGGYHSLALDGNGRVWAWGDNSAGQLGTGDFTNRDAPALMNGPYNNIIKTIAAGGWHSLILDDQGSLYGCGWNAYGQLAQHNFTARFPSPVFISRWVKEMAGGFAHTIVQTTYNSVFCAGYNAYGQIGDGTTLDRDYLSYCGDNVRTIAAGWGHSLVIRQDGTVWAWGRNDRGQLSVGNSLPRLTPTLMSGVANAKAVAAGTAHTLVQTANGNVLATGDNEFGQLGDGTTISRSYLAPVKNASLIGSIATGVYHSVLLKPFTKTLATGMNNLGQLGIGNTVQKNTPVEMLSGNSILAVDAGSAGSHSLLLRADGSVWATGWNGYGQLGNGTTTDSLVPVRVKGPGGVGFLSNIIAIAAGDVHSMALAADGTVYTWGFNGTGALGLGDMTHRYSPARVPGSRNVFAIAAGGFHSLLLADEGWVGGCGANGFGQLGLNDTSIRTRFTRINNSFGQTAVAAGISHSMSLDYFAGSIYSWGSGFNGQLALGDTLNRYMPTYQPGTYASTIACGGMTSMCLNARGEIYVSGYNYTGMLGLWDTMDRRSWTHNGYIPKAIGIAGGYLHSLFLNVEGRVYSSGAGDFGQLGYGEILNTSLPVLIPRAPWTTSVAAGGYHSLLLTAPQLELEAFTINPATVRSGTSTTGTLTLNGLAGPGGKRFYLYTDDNSAVTIPAYVDVAPTSRTVTFPIRANSILGTRKIVRIWTPVSANGHLVKQVGAILTIQP
jgi:alpha-tubulin suppressor-like RCC1 family protein